MQQPTQSPGSRDAEAIVLGYLNFSTGVFDPAAWRSMNAIYAAIEPAQADGAVAERADVTALVATTLRDRLAALEADGGAFRDATQARAALNTVFDRLLPAYREFHADLLEHQPRGAIERPFFLMAAFQALLGEAGSTDHGDATVARAISRLNDYVGWRPVAVLENGRLSEPYPHERVRPIPLFVAGAGTAHGRYRQLVAGAIEILAAAPVELLRQADFELDALDELAIDPRAFDFMHPAASRPNYLFGLWDPGRIDERGFYRRMVVQQATLDGILSWPAAAAGRAGATPAQLRWEAAAVLAGVMLMASGLSGHGPGALQAGRPLAELLPRIAAYRDEFYRRLLATLPADHRDRLEDEARRLRQPFGGVRRHINAVLASLRARQVENVTLAAALAKLGRSAAAERLAAAVPAASARFLARITGRVVAARQALVRSGDTPRALDDLDAARELLFRAIACGAVVDPWNILGLAGQFPLHEPGGESLPDPRVDDLVATTGSILDGYASAWRHAALESRPADARRAESALERLAGWWDGFATTTVSGVPHLSGRECADSAREVIDSLSHRRAAGPQPLPAGFWRREVAGFSSPRTHAQAADALLHERDLDGAAGLLVHWVSLLEGDAVDRSGPTWLAAARRWLTSAAADDSAAGRGRVRRFLELVEANLGGVVDVIDAATVGRLPGEASTAAAAGSAEDDDQAEAEERLAAAYESMVWRDSTDDGVDDGMIDVDLPGATPAAEGLAAVEDAAEFLRGVGRLFRQAVTAWCGADARAAGTASRAEIESVMGWQQTIRRLRRTMVRAAMLIAARDRQPAPGMSPTEFDRLRWQRDAAAERLVEAAVQAGETLWMLAAWLELAGAGGRSTVGRLVATLMRGDAAAAAGLFERVCGRLTGRTVLYVPLSRGGRPDRIVRARTRERLLERLAASLPRVGLVRETVAVVQLAKALESRRPAGAASVSEFDRVFEAATTALVERIVESGRDPGLPSADATARILDGLSLLVPRLLDTWMTHARQLRLSVLERVRDDKAFAVTREFVERYGSGLFTQHMLAPASLRGILRGGVRPWLEQLVERVAGEPEEPDGRAAAPTRLVEDLVSGALPLKQAAARLKLVLESVAENHAEYRDWNSTTTQSDRGECLHILLDYLRVKSEHDRIAWTLRPVNMAHRVLARRGASDAAEAWRARLRDETRDTAAALVARLDTLEAHWSVRLASVGDRIRRPFALTLELDELESLVEPAVAELVTAAPAGAGAALEARAEGFLGVASGSGVEVPEWLERLTTSIERSLDRAQTKPAPAGLPDCVAWAPLPWDTLRSALAG